MGAARVAARRSWQHKNHQAQRVRGPTRLPPRRTGGLALRRLPLPTAEPAMGRSCFPGRIGYPRHFPSELNRRCQRSGQRITGFPVSADPWRSRREGYRSGFPCPGAPAARATLGVRRREGLPRTVAPRTSSTGPSSPPHEGLEHRSRRQRIVAGGDDGPQSSACPRPTGGTPCGRAHFLPDGRPPVGPVRRWCRGSPGPGMPITWDHPPQTGESPVPGP